MSTTQNGDRSGRFPKGVSGNPGGRPQGLARATRELVGEDGHKLTEFWWSIMQDETRRDSDRLEASRLLADQGWGKAAVYEPRQGDPLDLAALEGTAEEFRASILRLAADPQSDTNATLIRLGPPEWPQEGHPCVRRLQRQLDQALSAWAVKDSNLRPWD
jgi:uncharacterized protein DUF5681